MNQLLKKAKKFATNPGTRFHCYTRLGLHDHWSDERFLKESFRHFGGKELDLDDPKSFNEKLQWLKLHDRRPVYTTMADKYAAKKFAAELIGDEYIVPQLGVWDTPEEIDFDSLPRQFVLKTTHDSGGVIICRDKETLNIQETKKILRKHLQRDFFLWDREWPYKDIPRRILAEKYMTSSVAGGGVI